MGSTVIDFAGNYGTPYAVYEAEPDGEGKVKLSKTIFKPHPAQVEFFSATERHVLLHGNRGLKTHTRQKVGKDGDHSLALEDTPA
jgi:hypothetical protein